MKYASIKHLARALVAALAFPTAALAATPVAVWDGNFNAVQPGYTLNLNGNQLSSDNSVITINQSVGVTVDFTTGMTSGMTVMFKYSNLNLANATNTLATSYVSGQNENRTGVCLVNESGNGAPYGIWNTDFWLGANSAKTTANLNNTSGVLVFKYQPSSGTSLSYVGNNTSSTIYACAGLGSPSYDTQVNGFSIGGERTKAGKSLLPAAIGMQISAIAVFNGVLSTSDMTDYKFPMDDADPVTADTTVSTLNAQFGSATDLKLKFSPGVKLTMDTTFTATSVKILSGGSIELVAATQPDAAELAKIDLSGVQVAAKRSWLTPGVVGINFAKGYGNVTSGELVTSDSWVPTTGASGTSTDLFADGLTKITWSSANEYSYHNKTDTEASPFIYGYLDDGPNKGNGAELTIEGVPYETYDVVIYASTDTENTRFRAKAVNGTTYTVNPAGVVSVGADVWGSSRQESPAYGINAMRVRDLSGTLTIYGGLNNYSSGGGRGGIAAIQIMPSEPPESEAILTLDGANANWSSSTWRNEAGTTISAPTSGQATIVFTASSTLTVDESVSLDEIAVRGATNAVLTLVLGGTGSIASSVMTVKSGVLKLGTNGILDATPVVYVEADGTLDLNSLGLSASTKLYLAGAGAGDWPWALTSSSGAGGAILGGLYLTEDATIGGANELKVGQTQDGYYCYLQGFTLTKTGAGAFTGTNMNTPGTGTIDMQGGAMSVNQWNNLNSGKGDTTLTLRDGASFSQNSSSHQISVHTFNFLGGTLNTPNPLYVKSAFTGGGETAKLVFRTGAAASLTRDLTVTDMTLDGAATFNRDAAAANSVTVRPVSTLTAPGTITVGSGVVFDLGTKRPSDTTFAGSGIIALTLAYAGETSVLKVANEMTSFNVLVYDTDGVTPLGRSVAYNSEAGTITITPTSLAPFIHYDFNNSDLKAATSPYWFTLYGTSPTLVNSRNGKAARFNTDSKPYWNANTSGYAPFYSGQMSVMSLMKVKEANNTIVWNFGSGMDTGIALIAKDSTTLSIVSWANGAQVGTDVVSVTGIDGLISSKSHLVVVVADAKGTTLYVDGLSASTDTVLPAGISAQGQFGSIHSTKKNYNWIEDQGFTIDDWRIYDVALTPAQVEALCDTFLAKSFRLILR